MDWIIDAITAIAAGLAEHLFELATAAAVAVAGYGVQVAKRRWDWADALVSEERVQEEVERAIRYVRRHAEEYTDLAPDNIEGPEFVERAVDYIIERTPEAMERAGVTREAVRGWVEDALD